MSRPEITQRAFLKCVHYSLSQEASHRQEYRPNPTYGRNPRDSRGEGARVPGPREWGPHGSLTVHGGPGAPGLAPAGAVGPTRQPHPRARAADGRAPRGGHSAAGAEEGGGAARVDGVDGVPAVGGPGEGVDGVDGGAAMPEEAAPRWEAVRGDDGGGPELGGDGGERERRRELDSGGETVRQGAETGEGGAGRAAGFAAAAALGLGGGGGSGGRSGMTGGPHASARVAGGPARQRRARGEGGRMGHGERRERGREMERWAGPAQGREGGLFRVELPQLSPSALVRIAIFDWACRTFGFEPNAELFGAIFFATVNSKTVITPAGTKKTVFGSVNFNVRPERSDLWLVNAAMSKWDRHWMARWFYHTIPFKAGSESAKSLRCRRRAITPNRRPNIAVNGAMEARFVLLRKANDEAGPSRKRMRGQVKLAPKKRRVPASSDSDADDEDDAEECDGEEEGEEEEEVEAVADKAAGYTPTPSPGNNETGVESNSSPLRRKDLEGAKALVAFSSGAAAKGGPIKKVAKTKGLVDVARVFSDNESSDGTPTSPTGRSLDLSAAPIPPIGAAGVDGSTAAGASASAIVTAAAKVFGNPPHQPVASPLMEAKGKRAVAETSALEYSLSVPRFAPGDFETRADLLPFVEGVSNLVLPASAPSMFTELNEFDEGSSRLTAQRSEPCELDLMGSKAVFGPKDDELGHKNLETEALANSLKEAKAENKRLQSELEKGKEARAEVDRLKAELEKEKAHTAVLIDYYNLTEPKMEALRQEVHKAEASAAEESRRFSREMGKTTESSRTACQTLRLTLTDMGTKVRGVPSEDASAFDFSEWTQQAGGSVSDCATAYGDCCARQFGCEHIAEFPKYAKGDWEISAQDISPALRAWRKQFWQKDGRSAAKARLLAQLAKAEAADLCEDEGMAAGGGGGDARDHPEV
uniref:Uncharacterized protein n=1 Tax=Oryza sativa subsp. japonica TaxID=39947 RepID=Q65WS6_ORYSJ|nr:hypothetical protein [Oryza sativa Japonica Group]